MNDTTTTAGRVLDRNAIERFTEDYEWSRDHDQLPIWSHAVIAEVIVSHDTLAARVAELETALEELLDVAIRVRQDRIRTEDWYLARDAARVALAKETTL